MSDTIKSKGHCLCGAIEVSANSMSTHVGACHCGMCRKWGGGPLMAVDCGTEVGFTGSENITVFSSSEWAERGFCKQCGSHLFYRLKETQQYIMSAGLFDNVEDFVFDHQVFVDSKPAYYHFANKTKELTEAEVFAQFASPENKKD